MTKFVTVYTVTRHYGGPEEGGWWYDWLSPVESVPVAESEAEAMADALYEKHVDLIEGDRFSVLGGTDVSVFIEDERLEFATTERPHYE